jgi:hypothetical protein
MAAIAARDPVGSVEVIWEFALTCLEQSLLLKSMKWRKKTGT